MKHIAARYKASALLYISALLLPTSLLAQTETYVCNVNVLNQDYKPWIPSKIIFALSGRSIAISQPRGIDVIRYDISQPSSDLKTFKVYSYAKATNGQTYITENTLTVKGRSALTYDFAIPEVGMSHKAKGSCRVSGNVNNQLLGKASNTKTTTLVSNCDNRPAVCSYIELCSKATVLNGMTYSWRENSSSRQYRVEANRRGAKCGVLPQVANNNASSSAEYSRPPKQSTAKEKPSITNQKPSTRNQKTYTPPTQTTSSSNSLTNQFKQQCSDIGYSVGTEKHADCALKLITLSQSQQQNPKQISYNYSQADRICDNEASASAQSNYKPSTPSTKSYDSTCTGFGNSINCTTTEGELYDGGFGNFANSMSTLSNRRKLYRACMLRLGHEPKKPDNILKKIFGTK